MPEDLSVDRTIERLVRQLENIDDRTRFLENHRRLALLIFGAIAVVSAFYGAGIVQQRRVTAEITAPTQDLSARADELSGEVASIEQRIREGFASAALRAELLEDIGRLPIGGLVPFYGTAEQVPQGFLLCDGGTVAKSEHPELYLHLVQADPALRVSDSLARLPDLRAEFLRGLDSGRGVDPRRKLGESQPESVGRHTHRVRGFMRRMGTAAIGADNDPERSFTAEAELQAAANDGKENRPRNVAVNFLIRG